MCSPALLSFTRAGIPNPVNKIARIEPTRHRASLRTPTPPEHTKLNREIKIADTPDGTKCRIWVHTKELAELRHYGSTTAQLRQLVYDSHNRENQNETLNTALERITGWTTETLQQHPNGWRRYALRWPT